MLPTYHERELFVRAALPVFAGVYDIAGDAAVHGHDFVEIAVVGAGTGLHDTANGRQRIGAGDVIVLRPGAWHGFAGCRGLIVANTCLSTLALREELGFLRDVPGVRELLWLDPLSPGRHGVFATRTDPSNAADAVEDIAVLEGQLKSGTANHVVLLGQLLTILGAVLGAGAEPVATAGARRDHHPAVAAVTAELDARPEHPWRVDDLGRMVHLDPAYLTRLFGRDVGLSPMGYLARVRAERAASLLTRTDHPTARIGALVGWPDPSYFARRFRTLVGLTPTEYRKRSRGTGLSR
ncbi:MAG: AraC family transcriptional regulator [Micromonosporaceae bacterium]